ncbi:MAG: DEAD/DEAH box helicase family protein [Deltaproteobacteria bacterium]|nr:DEAD/DEAH box helicase family protein [Deltaproteobacteria bacterium]
MIQLEFSRGTLLVRNTSEEVAPLLKDAGCVFDKRVQSWRAPALCYRQVVLALREAEAPFQDEARDYEKLNLISRLERTPFPYQQEALDAWWKARGLGTVILPTGAGKTYLAQMVMEKAACSTLVATPTLDLMQQWYGVLSTSYDQEIGLLGGGYHEPKAITVTTYDSAFIHMERLGNRFGLLIFDECHHLPGPSYSQAAELSLAPFRLGLTATPERQDGEEWRLDRLTGPIVYRREIDELAGHYLSDYETVRLRVRLSEAERESYLEERALYRDFVARHQLRLGQPGGWARFLMMTSRSELGRRAFLAYRNQKTIAQASGGKLRLLGQLLERHCQDRVLVFTNDNRTVYRISQQLLIPAITHQTPVKERHLLLQGFNSGDFPFLVTSKVLNEGVDVPAANVGIVLSGSGSVREHVQRLGRILRRGEGKQAVLYEVVAEDTAEEFTSERRRRHRAYQ